VDDAAPDTPAGVADRLSTVVLLGVDDDGAAQERGRSVVLESLEPLLAVRGTSTIREPPADAISAGGGSDSLQAETKRNGASATRRRT